MVLCSIQIWYVPSFKWGRKKQNPSCQTLELQDHADWWWELLLWLFAIGTEQGMELSYKAEKNLPQETGEKPQSLPSKSLFALFLATFCTLLFQGILIFMQNHYPLSHPHHFIWSCLSGFLCLLTTRSGRGAGIIDPILQLRKQWGGYLIKL